ncbi:MAG: PLP-dependent aminotransferase family protein [Rhizobiaceae bacterium]
MRKSRYTKLADVVAKAIENGSLPPGKRLPTHRSIAEQYGVALATATRAYRELERRGLIVGEAGRGMFVRDPGLPLTLGVEQTATEGMIDLVFNMPGDTADPDILRAGLKRLAASGDVEAMLRYQPHGGRPHERMIIASDLKRSLGEIEPECLLITSGGQHGLAIAVLGLMQRGDVIATDALTYPGFKSIAALHGLTLLPITNAKGCMNPEDLEHQCRTQKLRAVYLMPTVHNPLGTVMDMSVRMQLVEVARRNDLIIIEDSAYAFLEPDPPLSFIELAPERTVHIGGFSKSLATGLRLGYLIAPAHHVNKLSHVIRATTWNAPALISALVTGWIEDGTLDRSEENRRRDGAQRQRLCHDILGDIQIVSHRNAGFAWLPLSAGRRAEPIVASLNEKGVSVSTGEPFSVTDAVPQALRIAFGGISKNELIPAFEKVRDAVTC